MALRIAGACVVFGAFLTGVSLQAADSLQISLQVSNYNSFQVSCFGMKDGWINLSVSGGEAPYVFKWSNGSEEEDQSHLAAGYYRVDVMDQGGQVATAQVTLEQPLPMKLDVDLYEYPNGYNISCYECNNGNASVVVMGGASPFTVNWSDGPTGANRYNLGPKDYKITVADANGCEGASATILLRGPERSDWSMSGNANTVPGNQYIGTPDNKDVVFKSNGQERIRLLGTGDIKLAGAGLTSGPLYLNADGNLRSGGIQEVPPVESNPCADGLGGSPYWKVGGNAFSYPQCQSTTVPLLGTTVPLDVRLITNGLPRMTIGSDGKVGIGTTSPLSQLHVEGDLLVRGGTDGDIVTTHASGTGPVLWARNNTQAAWGLSTSSEGKGHILGNWASPQPILTFTGNRVGIVTTDPEATLHVDGDLLVRGAGWNGEIVTSSSATTGPVIWARNYSDAWGLSVDPDGKGHILKGFDSQQPIMTFADERVGIGTTSPESSFHVEGDMLVRTGPSDLVTSYCTDKGETGTVLWARNQYKAWGLSIDQADGRGHILGNWNDPFPLMTFDYSSDPTRGRVAIGTEDMPGDEYCLYVAKGILTEKVKVAMQNTSEWSDHVFQPNYRLMPLKEVDAFIKEHGHLPGVPSAAQMVESGLDVVKTDAMLMEKIEEIILHLIAMEKQIQGLQQENLDLHRRLLKH